MQFYDTVRTCFFLLFHIACLKSYISFYLSVTNLKRLIETLSVKSFAIGFVDFGFLTIRFITSCNNNNT